ncbi:Cell division control protein 48 homolog B [Linum perenne]
MLCNQEVLYVPPPDKKARLEILDVHTRNMSIGYDVDLKTIAEKTELFTGAELEGLCREAGIMDLREDISANVVSNKHFQAVVESLKPALTTDDIEEYSSFLNMRSPSKIGLANVNYSNAKIHVVQQPEAAALHLLWVQADIRLFMFLSGSVNSISSMPSPMYQSKKAFLLNKAVNMAANLKEQSIQVHASDLQVLASDLQLYLD